MNGIEELDKIIEEAACGARNISSVKFKPEVWAAADRLFEKHGLDPGEYQGFLIGVAWAILTDQV